MPYGKVQFKLGERRRTARRRPALGAFRQVRHLALEMVLDESSSGPVSSRLFRPLPLLLELAVEDLKEELGELLRVLLLTAVEFEGVDERRGVVYTLTRLFEEGKENLELEDRARLGEDTLSAREGTKKTAGTHLDVPVRRWKARVHAGSELGIAEPNLRVQRDEKKVLQRRKKKRT
jgi:hypothetical protein